MPVALSELPAAKPALARKLRALVSSPAKPAGERIVVVGNGMASHKLCEKLAAASLAGKMRITVIGDEMHPAYDRVHLTDFLKGRPPEQLSLGGIPWYQTHGIELRLGDRVTAIHRSAKTVVTESGAEIGYDRLVLATGSRAYVPPIPGADLPGVFVYRTLEDLRRIQERIKESRRAAVMGGGLLGLEAAKALHDAGLKTWIVERGTSLLVRQLDPKCGALLRSRVEKQGLIVCASREVERIEPLGGDLLLQFNTGECLRVQMAVIAVGVRPRDELAAEAGLELGRRGGIRVNDFLETSDPAISAIGECACHQDICYGLAGPSFKMADVGAANLLGKRVRFGGSDQSTRLKLSGVEVATLGEFQANGETLTWQNGECVRKLVLEKGRLVGATALGDWPEAGRAQEIIERRGRVWRWQKARFIKSGRLWKDESAFHVARWPETALVCNCVGVKRGDLSLACAQGCATIEQLAQRTGASTVCGSCRPLLGALLDAPASLTRLPGLKALAAASVLTLIFVAAILWMKPIVAADSVQSLLHKIDLLWREEFWKRVTGFTLAGLALLSAGLSLRKRIKRFRWGEFGHWRAVHAILGALTLIVLVSHTGFRLGHNLNMVLTLNFLALAAVGALAGGVAAMERRISPLAAKRLRALWTGAHIFMAWPLPALVAVHVLVAFYF